MRLLHLLLIALVSASSSMIPHRAIAQSAVQAIFSNRAQGLESSPPTVKVWAGSGTNISFIALGERVQKVWLDDPSKVTLDFDSPLCSNRGSGIGGGCKESNAMVVHLRLIKPLNFANLPQVRHPLLTIVTTDSSSNRKLYHFRVVLASGQPQYSTLAIVPESRGTPLIELAGLRRARLEDVERGLTKAMQQNLVNRNQGLPARIQNFIALVRNGALIQDAAQRAGVSMALVTRLAEMGLDPSNPSGSL